MSAAAFHAFKPVFVREIGSAPVRPTLAKFEVGGGLRVILRDAARRELVLRVGPAGEAPGTLGVVGPAALDRVDEAGDFGEAGVGWQAAARAALEALAEKPGWAEFLRAVWVA